MSFFKENNIEVDFFDFKKDSPSSSQILEFSKKVDINILLNSKGAKYRNLGLKDMNLSDEEKLIWLEKEPMLFKRPVVQSDNEIIVAFDEEIYKEKFL